jgi:hypothetical protein
MHDGHGCSLRGCSVAGDRPASPDRNQDSEATELESESVGYSDGLHLIEEAVDSLKDRVPLN